MKLKRSGIIGMIVIALLVGMLVVPLSAVSQATPTFTSITGNVTINTGSLDPAPSNVRGCLAGTDDWDYGNSIGGEYGLIIGGTTDDIGTELDIQLSIDGVWEDVAAVCIVCDMGAPPKFVGPATVQQIDLTFPSGGPVVPAVAFDAANYDVTEGGGKMINVVLSGTTTNTVTVGYSTVSIGDALPGVDYNTTSGTLTFNPGELTKSFQVTTINDTEYEPVDEVFHVQLANANNANLGAPNPATVTIWESVAPIFFATSDAQLIGFSGRSSISNDNPSLAASMASGAQSTARLKQALALNIIYFANWIFFLKSVSVISLQFTLTALFRNDLIICCVASIARPTA